MRWIFWICVYSLILIISFIISTSQPLVGDEEQYAIAIKDVQQYGIRPHATYFGEPMFWKPPLSFALYSIITNPLMGMLPETVALRIPSLLFIILGVVAFYFFVRDELEEEKTKYALLILLLSTPVFIFGTKILTDIPAFAFLIVMLYSLKNYAKNGNVGFIVLYALSLLIIGLTKSAAISLFAFLLSTLYCETTKNTKEQRRMLMSVVVGGVVTITLFLGYPLLFPSHFNDIYKSSLTDLTRIVMPSYEKILANNIQLYTLLMFPIGILAIFFAVNNILKNRVLSFYEIWVLSSLVLIISAWGFLPWYLLFFVPAFAYVIAKNIENNFVLDKIIIVTLLIISVVSHLVTPFYFFRVSEDAIEIMEYTKNIGENKTMLITRISDGTVNAVYSLPYKVVVTPENGMLRYDSIAKQPTFYGIKEEVIVPENIYGLIYTYDDESLLPKFIDKLDTKELYIPPVARTRKYWDGGFDIIIAKNDYADLIKKVAPEYKVVYTTSNSIYYVFKKED